MITWAIVTLAKHGAEGPIGLILLISIFADVVIFFLIVCALRGWPK